MNTTTNDQEALTNDEIGDITGDDIAAFVSGPENEPDHETDARTRRVLTQALCDSAVRERLLWLRSARAEWEANEANEANASIPIEAARLSALQERLREATLQNAGLSELDVMPEQTDSARLWNVWKTGGGRWAAGATISARNLLKAVQHAGREARDLTLGGHRTTLSLPCLMPAHAAPATEAAPQMHSDAITTADGVRITFQQSPSSRNRMRVLVDASHLTTANGADGGNPPPFNVAFLTLMEGDEKTEPAASHSRHLLVVTLNERGKGHSDFSVTPGDGLPSDADAQKIFPAPHAGGCRLVAATLSQMPPTPDALDR